MTPLMRYLLIRAAVLWCDQRPWVPERLRQRLIGVMHLAWHKARAAR